MLHSLNAVRVLAEFWVVHQHLAHFCGGGMPMVVDLLTRDLMCFFFVLSGFVMTYAHRDDDFSTWKATTQFGWRRFSKVYPVFLFFWVVSFIFYASGPEWRPHDLPCQFTSSRCSTERWSAWEATRESNAFVQLAGYAFTHKFKHTPARNGVKSL